MPKKGKKDPTADMTEEERVVYLQQKAQAEEEAARKKEELLTLFLKVGGEGGGTKTNSSCEQVQDPDTKYQYPNFNSSTQSFWVNKKPHNDLETSETRGHDLFKPGHFKEQWMF